MLTRIVGINPGKDGRLHLHVQYIADRKIKRWPTGVRVAPDDWDQAGQKLRPKATADVKADTVALSELQARIDRIVKDYFGRFGEQPSIEYVTSVFSDEAAPAKLALTPVVETALLAFFDEFVTLKTPMWSVNTVRMFNTLRNHLTSMQAADGKVITFTSVDSAFIGRFQRHLLAKGHKNTTVSKQLTNFKVVLNHFVKEGVNQNLRFRDFSAGKRTNPGRIVIALTAEEFKAVRDLDLSGSKRLAQVRDLFVLSCLTGLRYSDFTTIKPSDVKGGTLRVVTHKTQQALDVPLNATAREILARSGGQLPRISNQKYNDYIKEVGTMVPALAEEVTVVHYYGSRREEHVVPKHALLSSHTGRRTFATMMMAAGVPAPAIMRITGHTSLQVFFRYVNYRGANLDAVGGALAALD